MRNRARWLKSGRFWLRPRAGIGSPLREPATMCGSRPLGTYRSSPPLSAPAACSNVPPRPTVSESITS